LFVSSGNVFAEGDLLMARSQQSFPEAMLTLQTAIKDYGYTISRVQRVDIGLTRSGYKTDKYRIVFFGKASEVNAVVARHPELMAYLPLKIAIFAEAEETVLVTLNPSSYKQFTNDKVTESLFSRWENDLRAIMAELRTSAETR
jgi:uncharacterized protein (DUF302 family)